VLVGLLLPAATPDQLELARQPAQVITGGGRKEMDDPLDGQEAARRRPGGVESEQRDHAVDVDQHHTLSR
jgi:hypothetical protein